MGYLYHRPTRPDDAASEHGGSLGGSALAGGFGGLLEGLGRRRAFGARLDKAGAPIRAAGLGFGWHNHDFEFKPQADGSVPMAAILEGGPNLEWEMDVAWVVRGGSDPFAWIEAHKGRITAAHDARGAA